MRVTPLRGLVSQSAANERHRRQVAFDRYAGVNASRARSERSGSTWTRGTRAHAEAVCASISVSSRRDVSARRCVREKSRSRTITLASSGDVTGVNVEPPRGSANPIDIFVAGLRDRLEIDPNFFFKLVAEILVDFLITLTVNIMVRGNPTLWSFSATLMVMCQLLTAFINDTLIVYFLAPTALSAKKEPEIANVFAKGDYSLSQRAMCYFKKGRFYAIMGAISCVVSMFLASSLAGNAGGFTLEVFYRALACGALHMGISSNTRYQLVNGIERVAYDHMSTKLARSTSVTLRMGNNFLGARLWMMIAAFTGLS